MNLCPSLSTVIVRSGCNSVQNASLERCWAFVSFMGGKCDILCVWMELHLCVYSETVLHFGSKERLVKVYFEHSLALHFAACTLRCRQDTFIRLAIP